LFGNSLFAFEGLNDSGYAKLIPGLLDAIIADRKAIFFSDSLRTLILVVLAASVLFFFLKEKLSKNISVIVLGVLILFDLVTVDKKYVNNDDFLSARKINHPFMASEIDKDILKDTSDYRVANYAANLMNDGSTSYFHKSVGGYHAAKLGRYQELFDYQIAKNNMEVLNMLNTKYFIFTNDNNQEVYQPNKKANGNVWFVHKLKFVTNANDEIRGLDSLHTKKEAIIDKRFVKENLSNQYDIDSTETIKLISHKLNELNYNSEASDKQFAVFSEIYYKNGWNAYLDGKLANYYRVNYVLRGMEIPKGKHKITFKFEPTVIKTGTTIMSISYGLLILIAIGWFFLRRKN
jgi:hypothetical protein